MLCSSSVTNLSSSNISHRRTPESKFVLFEIVSISDYHHLKNVLSASLAGVKIV
jgi:hypothetical protein